MVKTTFYFQPREKCPNCESTKISSATLEQTLDMKMGSTLQYAAPLLICDECSFRWQHPLTDHMQEVAADWMFDLELGRVQSYGH